MESALPVEGDMFTPAVSGADWAGLGAEIIYFKFYKLGLNSKPINILPIFCNFNFQRRNIIFEIYSRSSMRALPVGDRAG